MAKVFVAAQDLVNEDIVLIDARYNLADQEEGRQLYNNGHIDEALHWDLTQDLSDRNKEQSGRHPMPEKQQLQALFQRSGLQLEDAIVIYDQGGAPFATRAYYLLTYAGFPNVRVVEDGMNGLLAAGFEFNAKKVEKHPTKLNLNWQDDLYVNLAYVKEVTEGQHDKVLLDARAHNRYIGLVEPMDPIAGHIPGARNFDWEQLAKEGRLFANDALQKVVNPAEKIIVYCGSGVSASPVFAALTELGYEHIQLYTGSYSEWVAHYPIATGEER
ncbi:sulfurtransferase [Kurthia sibirica]|uniref:Sulfurtransferase n=1 Tax=Kurthia sibirica TaxID=202750 RepID=A0A2U3APM9_9BACL|nr:sulfurtransferase [Kurthia sibirica]PWI26487.1 sulfurtransferase [Kurthia sibirica]GEK33056.1 thiosulfate sulfurtransferase [Kurthia sibirica]